MDEDLEAVDYAVFDDMMGGLEFWHSYKFWLGAQKQFYATDKYKGKKLIKWGRPCIYVSNNDPREDKGADINWLEGNCVFHYVSEPLFSARASTMSPPGQTKTRLSQPEPEILA